MTDAAELRPLGRDGWLRVGIPAALSRGALLAFVFVAMQLMPPALFRRQAYRENFHWPPGSQPTVESRYKTWDGQHYLYLAQEGYQKGMPSNAFYPLWPLLIRAGSFLTGGNLLVSALILANLFTVFALMILHALVKQRWGEGTADISTLLLAAYPGSMFLLFPYTEALFLLLCLLFFLFVRKEKLGLAAGVGFLLPLTRAVGIFIALPLAWAIFQRWRSQENRSIGGLLRPGLLVLAPAAGWAVYFLVLYVSTGNVWEGFEAQDAYVAERSVSNIVNLKLLVTQLLSVGTIHGLLDSGMDRFWFLLLVALLVPIWKLDRGYFLFCLGVGLVPAMTGSFLSYTRFFIIVFPAFIVLGRLFSRPRWQGLGWVVLGTFFSLQILFLIRHTNNMWVG